MITSFTLVLALTMMGVAAALRMRRRDDELTIDNALQRAPHLCAIGGVMIALGIVSLAAYLQPRWLWALPLAVEASFSVVIWRTVAGVMAFGFALTTTLAFAVRHPRRWALMVAFAAVILPVSALVGERTTPIASTLRVTEREGVVLQSSGVTCVSASAANLARLYGRHTTEPDMAELLGATSAGATSAQLVQGLNALGLTCQRTFHRERDLANVPPPSVIFYGDTYGVPHAVVLEARHGSGVSILDPLSGRELLPTEKVEASWDGEAVTCHDSGAHDK